MQADSTVGEEDWIAVFISASGRSTEQANRNRIAAVIDKFCGVMHHQNRSIIHSNPFLGGLEMAGKDLLQPHSLIGQKKVGRFGAGPILASQRNTFTDAFCELFHQLLKPPRQAYIGKFAPADFQTYPAAVSNSSNPVDPFSLLAHPASSALTETPK